MPRRCCEMSHQLIVLRSKGDVRRLRKLTCFLGRVRSTAAAGSVEPSCQKQIAQTLVGDLS